MREDPIGAISTCRVRRLAFLFIVVVVLAPTEGATGQSLCVVYSSGPPPFLPNPNKTLLTVEARAQYVPFVDTLQPYRYRPPRGQVVTVETLKGPGQGALGLDSLAIIVQWGQVDELIGCHQAPTRDSLPAGSRHLLTVELRPDSLWIAGRPTFDLHPGPYSAYTRHGRSPEAPSFATYRALLDTLPSREAWAADCRPGVAQVKRWFDAHPTVRRHPPFHRVLGDLGDYCLRSLKRHAEELERGERTEPIPGQLRELFVKRGCLDDSTTTLSFEHLVVDGRFVASEASQWAFTCPRTGDWQLLVAVMESPPRVIELLRMEGHEWNWLASAAAPEYLHWVCSRDVGSDRFQEPYAERDVVLLSEQAIHDAMLAFYETPGGWVHARTQYCEESMVGALDVPDLPR